MPRIYKAAWVTPIRLYDLRHSMASHFMMAGGKRDRGISRQIVKQCLAKGRLSGLDISGRFVRDLRVKGRLLSVVYIEVKGGTLVVTAYWKD